ncbi:CCA tRNA nucleotidyltransferase [Lapidilactobacillus luobeiensis]|uniref:CCA tRNA nucleotidyltransferase n=1 Tax=Lapidilactobacillus luobeiensis TaxID=2950371 RepID=UPI0021C3A63F|nr:CCA tRNA nucleotidyltransferase [Lapidilactobacillus luobeiensis]
MYLTKFPSEFQQALPILQQIKANGYEAYFVGGSVRDFLLGKPIADVDIATSAFPAEIKAIFPVTIDTGIKHGTVTVMVDHVGYEVTTFRTESGYQDFRRPDQVTFVRSLTQDLQRRDFTINALAVRHDGLVIDKFAGLADLKAGKIRAVGAAEERFHEDALRMMRAVRFSSQLDFTIVPETYQSLVDNRALLEKIAVERIHTEFIKMMLSPNWQRGWTSFLASGLAAHVPYFAAQRLTFPDFAQGPTTILGDEAAVWTLLASCAELTEGQLVTMLRQWKTANQVIAASRLTYSFSQYLRQEPQPSAWALYQLDETVLPRLAQVWANQGWSADFTALQARYLELPIHDGHELAINGAIVMQALALKPGPVLGRALKLVEQAVVEGEVENQTAALIVWLRKRLPDMI